MATYEEILSNLQNKIYKPVYFLTGEEPYYIDKITNYIAENVLTEAEQSFNQTVLYGKDSEVEDVINIARRFPMMANQQVVILKEAQELKKIEVLENYLENPLQSTILVINYKHKKLDKRTKFYKALTKKAVVYDSKKLRDNEVPGWIEKHLKSKGYEIDVKASMLLFEFLGTDLSKIINELEKLSIVLKENNQTKVTPEVIEKNIGVSKDYNNFELQNALVNKNVLKANKIITYFANNPKDNPLMLTLVILYGFYSKLLLYHYAPDKRNNKELASKLKINPYFLKDYHQAAAKYPAKKVVQIISLLREYDLKAKGVNDNGTPQGELLKELIFKIMH